MKYKNPSAIPVVAKLNGIEFKATVTEAEANKLFGELNDFESKQEFEDYLAVGDAAFDLEIEIQSIANEVDEDEEDEDDS